MLCTPVFAFVCSSHKIMEVELIEDLIVFSAHRVQYCPNWCFTNQFTQLVKMGSYVQSYIQRKLLTSGAHRHAVCRVAKEHLYVIACSLVALYVPCLLYTSDAADE